MNFLKPKNPLVEKNPELQQYIDLYEKFSSELPSEEQGLNNEDVQKYRDVTGDTSSVFSQAPESDKFRLAGSYDKEGILSGEKDKPYEDLQSEPLLNLARIKSGVTDMNPQIQAPMPQDPKSQAAIQALSQQKEKPLEPSVLPSMKPMQASLDFGSSINTVDNMRDAQNRQNNAIFGNQILKSLNTLGAGIIGSGAKPQPEIFDEAIKDAQTIVPQFKELAAQEMNDPNSGVSKAFSKYAKQFGVNIKGASAKQVADLYPYLFKGFEAEQNRKATKENLKYKYEELRALKEINAKAKEAESKAKQEHKDEEKNKERFDKMGKLISSEVASSRSSFGVDARTLQAVGNAKALFDGVRDLNDLDQRQVYEVAKVLDRTLSQGQPTISGAKKFTPETAKSWVQGKLEQISNQRRGAQLGSFVKNMKETLDREGIIAEDRIKKTQRKLLSPYSDLKEKDPEKWELMMREHGLPSNPFEEEKAKVEAKQEAFPKTVMNKKTNQRATVKNQQELDEAKKEGFE